MKKSTLRKFIFLTFLAISVLLVILFIHLSQTPPDSSASVSLDTIAEDIVVETVPEPEPAPEPPHFIFLHDRKYKTGTELSLTDLVYAEDKDGNDITDRIIITDNGSYDPDTAGTYNITYSVTDDDKITNEETITISIGDYEANDYGFETGPDALRTIIAHNHFSYEPLAEEETGTDALIRLTSPTSFGAAYDDGACTCFLYRVTDSYLYFFTNKHCPVDSADTLCLYDHNDNMTEIPKDDITFLKYHPEYDAVANGYQHYDQQMFVVPIEYFDIDVLLEAKQVLVDTDALEALAPGDMFLMNTQSWRRCQKDIVCENTVVFTDGYNKTVYRADDENNEMCLSHMIVGNLKNSVGSCSGSPCFDSCGHFLGFLWGGTRSNDEEGKMMDQLVPATYFLEFTETIDFE